MSGSALAAVFVGVALGVGVSSVLAVGAVRHRFSRLARSPMPVEDRAPASAGSLYVNADAFEAEFERGYRALQVFLSQQTRPDESSQSAD